MTVREAARLQLFPDSFEFVRTKDSQFQQVGIAVQPLLAKGIAGKFLNIYNNIIQIFIKYTQNKIYTLRVFFVR